jgi:hypothetical protein
LRSSGRRGPSAGTSSASCEQLGLDADFRGGRGGSARSTAEPAARGAVEIEASRLDAPGVKPPETAIRDPEAFLGLLATHVRFLER